MLDKRNPYTGFGQALLSIGILNLIVRANIVLDIIISFFFMAKGGSLIRDKKWAHDSKWNKALTIIGMIYPAIKLFWIYFYMSDTLIRNSNIQITKADIIFTNSLFLVPTIIISYFAYRKLKTKEIINKD
ncbi:MAG: hypothetical protein KKD38_08590 [Candidatus Delongbacteria bacterium]|nr:hypothetical protein [Candidatus Delongbacteria bacterium]MCG2761406.1 hypothetical protein [Candidatus Delongbacteria bacterium]